MNSHLNSTIAAQHVNDLIADAHRNRLGRSLQTENRRPALVARLASGLRSGGRTRKAAPQATGCEPAVHS